MQAFLDAGVLLTGDGTSTIFVFDLNSVFVAINNNIGGIGFSALLPNLLPDSVAVLQPAGVVASLNKNKITLTFSSPPTAGVQFRADVSLGFNSL